MKKMIIALMLMAPTMMFAQKFGHVNTQEVMQSMPELAKVNGELEALSKQKENDMKAMQEELQRKADLYDKQASTMNATKKQETEAELQSLYQKVQQAYQDAQQEIQKAQQEKMNPIIEKVRKAINAVGQNGSYTMIFEDGVAIYTGDQCTDLTGAVKSELNKLK